MQLTFQLRRNDGGVPSKCSVADKWVATVTLVRHVKMSAYVSTFCAPANTHAGQAA